MSTGAKKMYYFSLRLFSAGLLLLVSANVTVFLKAPSAIATQPQVSADTIDHDAAGAALSTQSADSLQTLTIEEAEPEAGIEDTDQDTAVYIPWGIVIWYDKKGNWRSRLHALKRVVKNLTDFFPEDDMQPPIKPDLGWPVVKSTTMELDCVVPSTVSPPEVKLQRPPPK
jgi:hypothetical protein